MTPERRHDLLTAVDRAYRERAEKHIDELIHYWTWVRDRVVAGKSWLPEDIAVGIVAVIDRVERDPSYRDSLILEEERTLRAAELDDWPEPVPTAEVRR